MDISYSPATDLLGHSASLGANVTLPLLGVPVEFRSNSPEVIAAAVRALGRWRELPPELIGPGPPLRVAIVVQPIGPGDPPAAPERHFVFRAHGDTFLAASGANMLSAQMAHGQALAFVTPELAADEANLRSLVIECLGLILTTRRDRTPLHAAAVLRGGRAVLLAGPSTAGKSTLCYACLRAGFQLLADDVVHVGLERGLRLWGNPGRIGLLPDAPRLFPELAGHRPQLQSNGKLKIALDAASVGGLALTHRGPTLVCLLERRPGQASRLDPIAPAEVVAALGDPREPGFNLLRDQAPRAAQALAGGGAFRLSVGDPAGAVALLATLTEG